MMTGSGSAAMATRLTLAVATAVKAALLKKLRRFMFNVPCWRRC
jgi:hypothetical protein